MGQLKLLILDFLILFVRRNCGRFFFVFVFVDFLSNLPLYFFFPFFPLPSPSLLPKTKTTNKTKQKKQNKKNKTKKQKKTKKKKQNKTKQKTKR